MTAAADEEKLRQTSLPSRYLATSRIVGRVADSG
jgi:hypothetical protein